ncbi:unnamed protein product [Kuraishia capsulata CBS 1993]|uniref:Histone acetyltransferase type B catalytic subunit n=1 Tax=Kuraishia capsulata CBS 1993 TaxID=1382522 RepID=W6MMP9_9ASCO|nr:uncharacterized protein KUCA_T00002208001 [Kuraishia capsulata CBS 1993]CDK26237.1 unnamed protein product [Kuraishia capsulata CBS 1993]
MSFDPDKWTVSSNDALQISLAEPQGAFSFRPAFTYPVFGDSEQIFGYKDLKIALAFDCAALFPFLSVTYSSKLENHDDIIDVQAKLLEFLPKETIISDENKWLDVVEADKFEIPGTKIKTYHRGDEEFSIYKSTLSEASKLHLRIRIFVLLFIEAASYIDETDPVWEIYLVYKTSGEKPSFVGFSTVYSYWYFESMEKHDLVALKNDVLDLKIRKKISQFVILPPYQQKGHGRELYSGMVEQFLQDDQVLEICVEDPSEQFDDLRDRCDLERLYREGVFSEENDFTSGLDVSAWIKKVISKTKLEKRQFARLVEMAMLKNEFGTKEIRLKIKRRLYVKNKDSLVELDIPTRKDKLQTAYQRLEEDYLRILERVNIGSKKRKLAT